jgi:tetratricopeptide (TPR) repeat protein
LVMGIIFTYAIFSGIMGQTFFRSQANTLPIPTTAPITSPQLTPTVTVTVTPLTLPSSTPTRTRRPTFTLVATATPFPSFTPNRALQANTKPISYWNQIIAQDPTNADAYYQRATIEESVEARGGLDAYTESIEQALKDIDTAIALRSDIGDYYSLRQTIYIKLMDKYPLQVDAQYLGKIALDNAYKAHELGTSIEQYPDRIIITDLIFTNQCELALQELQKLMEQTPKDQSTYGGLLHIQSQAYACLGRVDEALKSVNDSMFNNKNMEYKKELKAEYLYLSGRYEEALPLLNEVISCCIYGGGGYRYYLRAAINYELGKKELILDDLAYGMANTWDRGSFLPYVEAQIALDEGRKQDAIQALQLAEATLSSKFNPLRWKIQKQLAALGAKPIRPTPSVSYQATPIP